MYMVSLKTIIIKCFRKSKDILINQNINSDKHIIISFILKTSKMLILFLTITCTTTILITEY